MLKGVPCWENYGRIRVKDKDKDQGEGWEDWKAVDQYYSPPDMDVFFFRGNGWG
jgi:hypothetical protein